MSFIKIRYQPIGRQVCLTMPRRVCLAPVDRKITYEIWVRIK